MKSTTTKRRTNANTANKNKKSAHQAGISGSATDNRGITPDEHNGDNLDNGNPMLASERGSEVLESGGDNSTEIGAVVSGTGVELDWETAKVEWSEEELSKLKSASECVFEVGDRVRVKLNAEVNHHHQDLLGKKGEVISIANTGYWVKFGYREVLIKTENLAKEEIKLSPEFEKNFASNFGRKPKAEENGQLNLLESEEDNGEAPDPDDFDNLEAFKTAWDSWSATQTEESEEELANVDAEEIWNQSNNINGSTCVPASVPGSPLLELNSGGDRQISSANETNIAETFSASDTLMPTSTEMSGISSVVELTSLAVLHPANRSALTETDLEQPTSETVSPLYSQQSENCSQNSQSLKMSQDCSPVQSDQEAIASTSLESLKAFPKAGTFANGNLSAADTLPPLGIGEESLLLRSPGALSGSDGVRPPGKNRLENQLEELGLLQTGEVANPEFLENGFGLPTGFSNPSETRTALELAQVQAQPSSIAPSSELPAGMESIAIAVQPSETLLTGELQPSASAELNTLQVLSNEINLGSLNKQELLDKAIAQHNMIGSIEREEFNLALEKLHRVRLAGMCLQEFKRRCKHGEFEGSLEQIKLKPRTAQNYMAIAKNWDLIKSKAHLNALLESGQTLGLNWALEAVRDAKRSLKSAAAPSDPDCWRTPNEVGQPILHLIKTALGIITLDPAADDAKSVPALIHYTKEDDGLSKDWEGYVFLNPPFSDPLPWIQKLCFYRARGDVRGAIALLKAGTINNQGTGELISKYASAICNWRGRIAFLNEDGQPVKGADFDCVFVYFGRDPQKFEKTFLPWGTVSWINQQVANNQLPEVANNQQLLTINNQQLANIKQEETAAAKSLGLSNGKSVLPDLRDGDRAISESHDPHHVPEIPSFETEINTNILNDYMVAVTSNAAKFANHQSGHMIKSLLKVNFANRVKGMLVRFSEQEIKSLMMLCDEELDERAKNDNRN